ncbi:hypothetical protein Tco_1040971 [Tanacetum coccineum]|uniref:Uncharacterized protein n=1 Tax=Tanacetum coccineum TaxID=301880 RepID=A0ABQ5GGC1_9ASTR
MSDSEDSTITYTEISSPYEDLSDIGSPGAEGRLFFRIHISRFTCLSHEEPEQAPPSPIYVPFVPEPVYPEFLPVDDVLPAEEQHCCCCLTYYFESPGYIPESDPEEDPEEDDEEDPEEDPADYPADRGDDRDDEEPSDDDDDDAEEEEHLAPTDPAAVAYSADQDPYLAYSPAGIRQRDALPSPVHETEMPEICFTTVDRGRVVLSLEPEARELGYGITDTWDDLVGAIQEIAPTTLEGVNQRVTELATTVDQEDDIIYSQLDDARHDRALLRA